MLTDGPSEADVLLESLETFRTKYKQEKESKKEWKRVRPLFLFFLVCYYSHIERHFLVLSGK